MLKYLHIENIAVIEKSDIEFTEGFNVLTGETGAGKSIIIDAINAVLGERTSKDLIRSGCDYGEVSALFGDFSEPTLKNLASLDISPDSDGNILITRKLSLSGKGLIKINGKPATAGDLREISSFLINIHGQHDNQALLNPEKHCGFIDAVADNSNILETYYDEFKRLNNIRKELQSLEIDENEKQRKIELLKYQIKELEDADIKIGEINDLKQKLSVAENFEQTQKSLSTVNAYLSGDEETDGAITLLKKALKPLLNLNSKAFESNISKLNEIISIAEDLGADIGNTLFNNNELSLDVNQINHRLDLLQRLMLKYGNSEELMLEFLTKAKTELENIEFSDKKVAQLSTELENSKLCLIEKAKELTNSRINASKVFEKDVCEVLSYLNMPNVKFVVNIKQGRYT
ncbi:MAG: AAA family ATPase, partial [Clostridia bacterium]|nr:AAA family ATPase [Clostridia bacterium]